VLVNRSGDGDDEAVTGAQIFRVRCVDELVGSLKFSRLDFEGFVFSRPKFVETLLIDDEADDPALLAGFDCKGSPTYPKPTIASSMFSRLIIFFLSRRAGYNGYARRTRSVAAPAHA